jgi:oligosaccharide reducing-end xylanase
LKIKLSILGLLGFFVCVSAEAVQVLERVESESGRLLPQYTGLITAPFSGVAVYANGDGVTHTTAKLSNAPGVFRIDLQGASTSNSDASISIFIDAKKVGSVTFSGTVPSIKSVEFPLESVSTAPQVRFVLETDNGSNDTLLNWYELSYVGEIPPPPPPPVLPAKGAYYTGNYRNLFEEVGYTEAEVSAKVKAAYNQLFHSTKRARDDGEAVLIPDARDASMAYIWDVGNDDVRSEGMSYGMMIAVQMDRQDDFNKMWKWANKYSLNDSGIAKGYFAWKVKTDGSQKLDPNPAADGEEYYVTALFFASHRWGDGTGIYNYKEQANQLLDRMYDNGVSHYDSNNVLVNYSLFDHDAKQVLFTLDGATNKYHTDPSYHLPAFYELWALWADNHNDFWKSLAVTSREFWKTTVHSETGLNPNYADFDGSVVDDMPQDHKVFFYDAWRTVGNAAMDYAWWKADEWQVVYAKRLQTFFKKKDINAYPSLYTLDGAPYNGNEGQSTGLVGMNAIASLASDSTDAWAFVHSLWSKPTPTGRQRYYDGTLYMLSMLAVSGQYRVYCPNNTCAAVSRSSSSAKPSSASARPSSASIRSSVTPSSTSASSSFSSIRSSSVSSRSVISLISSSAHSVSSSVLSSRANNDSVDIPNRIEAENYSVQSGIQTETTSDTDGGINIGYIENGDFVDYTINAPTSGNYSVHLRVASATQGGTLDLFANNAVLGSVAVNGTGGWQAWTTLITTVRLNAGQQTLRLRFSGGNGYLFNLNWIEFAESSVSSSSVSSQSRSSMSSSSSSSAGKLVCSHVILNEWNRGFTAGVRITNNGSSPVGGWSVSWKYSDGSFMTNSWNANVTGALEYTATPLPWLFTINPGQTIEIGVQVTKGLFDKPAQSTVAVTGPLCR